MSIRRLTLTGLVSLCALAIGASSAYGFGEIGSFGAEGSGAGQLKEPWDVAVNDTTHDVYVADTDNNRVEEFSATGAFVLMFGKEVNATKKTNVCTRVEIETEGVTCKAGEVGSASDEAVFSLPRGVAVDNSGVVATEGDVYVADSENNRVEVFSSSGAYLTEFNGSGTPETSFSEPRGLAVDADGNVYVADHGHGVVDKFRPLGAAFIASPYLTGLLNPAWNPAGVAVDSNPGSEAIYVANRKNNVEKFNYTTGAAEGVVDEIGTPESVAVNTVTNDIYVSGVEQVSEYNKSGGFIEEFGFFPAESGTTVAVDPSTGGDVYIALQASGRVGGNTVGIFDPLAPPAVSPTSVTGPPSHEQSTSAIVEGTVNPNEVAITECLFEYGTSTSYGQAVPCEQTPAGNTPVTVTATLSPLEPNIAYHYRLVAHNAFAAVTGKGVDETFEKGADETFNTLAALPTVNDRSPVVNATRTTARLSGTVNPENSSTTYHFEYGTTTAYGSKTEEASAGAGYGDVSVRPLEIVELQPETTYHYRLVATNGAGTEPGPDYTFTTGSRTPPLVSTAGVSGVTQTGATISGAVDPQGIETSYAFEVGTDTSYSGAKVFGDAGESEGAEPIAVTLEDLAPGTTYHYRLTATNADGTSYGQDMTFTTPGIPSPIGQPLTMPLLATPTIAFPAESGPPTKTTTKVLTRAQKLAGALKVCKKKEAKDKRAACEKQARKRYGSKPKAKRGAKARK
jgi:hypothetical protein